MNHIDQMLSTHPHKPQLTFDAVRDCIAACFDCMQSCAACADACLGESSVAELTRCIRLNLDCADVCQATGLLLSRQTAADHLVLRRQLESCIQACRSCGEECQRHAHHHEHCAVCAEACRSCEQACMTMISELGPTS